MPVTLGAKPLADFTQPIELMQDCHRRVEAFLDSMIIVATQCADGVLTPMHREALQTAVNYFRQGAPRHTEDEEQSLFPRLAQSDDPRAKMVLAAVESLEADHQHAGFIHADIDEACAKWLSQPLSPKAVSHLRTQLIDLRWLYAEHIKIEEDTVFPLAAKVLTTEQLAEVGAEMSKRRSLNPGRTGSRCATRRMAAASKTELES